MTLLLYTRSISEPRVLDQYTKAIFSELFPEQDVLFSETLSADEARGGKRIIQVVGGGNLDKMTAAMRVKGTIPHIRENLDNELDYIGFCTGAFLGAKKYAANKSFAQGLYSAEYPDNGFCAIDDTLAIGPFLPYRNATMISGGISAHTARISYDAQNFDSLYMEGPVFLNSNALGPYSVKENIVANYVLDYSVQLINSMDNKSVLDMPLKLPAVLHQQKGNSHRYLLGPHPELAINMEKFINSFQNEMSKVGVSFEMDSDLLDRLTPSCNMNKEFLKKTFSPLLAPVPGSLREDAALLVS